MAINGASSFYKYYKPEIEMNRVTYILTITQRKLREIFCVARVYNHERYNLKISNMY